MSERSGGGGPAKLHLQLGQIASDQFFLLPGEWSLERAQRLVAALRPKRVVVRSGLEKDAACFLLPAQEILGVSPGAGMTLEEAVLAAGFRPVPSLDAGLDADDAPEQCVVVEDGLVVGIFDLDLDVPDVQRGRSAGGAEPEAVTRILAAEMERRIPLGEVASLLILLVPPEAADPAGNPMALLPGSAVDVYLRTLVGFEAVGSRDARLVVAEHGETRPVQFRLRPTRVGRGRIEVFVFQDGSWLGDIVLTPEVVEEAQPEQLVRYESYLVPPADPAPDLALVIVEIGQGTDLRLLVRVGAPAEAVETRTFGPIPVRLDPLQCFSDFFSDIEKLGGTDERTRQTAIKQLESKGANLFEQLIPEDLQEFLWKIRSQIRSLRIESAEPWIPWEVCRLVGRDGGRIVEAGYLCEEFAMSRWILGMPPRHPPVLRKVGVIAPEASGLPAAAGERQNLLGLSRGEVRVKTIEPRLLEVMECLASGEYDGLHFAGHGNFRGPNPDRSRIILEDEEELRPENLSGERGNLGSPRPLVFLNACEAGRSAFSLTGMGGWAPRFLRAGAAAFIGPVWSVSDQAAGRFAEVFYGNLLAGTPIAEAARDARRQVRDDFPGNPAWLAYTLFADPLARVV